MLINLFSHFYLFELLSNAWTQILLCQAQRRLPWRRHYFPRLLSLATRTLPVAHLMRNCKAILSGLARKPFVPPATRPLSRSEAARAHCVEWAAFVLFHDTAVGGLAPADARDKHRLWDSLFGIGGNSPAFPFFYSFIHLFDVQRWKSWAAWKRHTIVDFFSHFKETKAVFFSCFFCPRSALTHAATGWILLICLAW